MMNLLYPCKTGVFMYPWYIFLYIFKQAHSSYSPVDMPYMTAPPVSYPSPPVPQGLIPSPEEVLPLLQNQAAQLRQVENERKFYQVFIQYYLSHVILYCITFVCMI